MTHMRTKLDYPPVGVRDVLTVMSRGIGKNKWLTVGTLGLFFVASVSDIFVPILYKKFFDTLSLEGEKHVVALVLVSIIVSVLSLRVFRWVTRNVALLGLQKIEPETMARLRQISFEYLANHSLGFFSNNFTGSLIQRVNRFARSFERLADTIAFHFIPLGVTIVGAIVVTWFYTPILSIIIMVWIAVFFICNYVFALWRVKYNILIAAADSKTSGVLADLFSNQNAITLFATLPFESNRFRNVTNEQAKITRTTWNINSTFDAIQAAIIFIAEFFIFYFSIQLWEKDAITIGMFVLVQVYIIQLASQLWDFGRIVRTVFEVFADSKEMVEMLLLPHEIKDVPSASVLKVDKGLIEFNDVVFNFGSTRTILNRINLQIEGGEKIALVGSSGAGKTTILRLLFRLYEVTSGHILIDGQDIQHVTQESLRKNIALVPQEPVLFHRTLIENIRYGRLDASDEEVHEAARLANCDFIENLPQGYNTFVGERGVKLSGGERQRIAIARAILKDAPILVLDEATSSLDSQSEALIQEALDRLMKGKTTIAVAHRLSTIRQMDRIIVLENGSVREDGTHDALLKDSQSLYRELWNLQAGGFIADSDEEDTISKDSK
ncbi:ABC transporter ATP-binding protein [Patescibacteria group bacterium]|nr:MAG: ABC transporter ATP-binding protein [Patescibacteria group bacterium]